MLLFTKVPNLAYSLNELDPNFWNLAHLAASQINRLKLKLTAQTQTEAYGRDYLTHASISGFFCIFGLSTGRFLGGTFGLAGFFFFSLLLLRRRRIHLFGRLRTSSLESSSAASVVQLEFFTNIQNFCRFCVFVKNSIHNEKIRARLHQASASTRCDDASDTALIEINGSKQSCSQFGVTPLFSMSAMLQVSLQH